jgi:alpha-galactosidase
MKKYILLIICISFTVNINKTFAKKYAVWDQDEIVLNNGLIERKISVAGNSILTAHIQFIEQEISADTGFISEHAAHLSKLDKKKSFFKQNASDFQFVLNGELFTGESRWIIQSVKEVNTDRGGKGVIITAHADNEKSFDLEVQYILYPGLTAMHKSIALINTDNTDLKLENLDIERVQSLFSATQSWVLRNYCRYKHFGYYAGNWDDPTILVHNHSINGGFIIGNEIPGVIKRVTALNDRNEFTSGYTRNDQLYPFSKWIKPGERWESSKTFLIPYNNQPDYNVILNTVLPQFVRKYMGIRLADIEEKPVFVYNTWKPFMNNISESLILEVVKHTSECGFEEFIIDTGWHVNLKDPRSDAPWQSQCGDWIIDPKKFPNGFKPIFDYVKSLGMKPGLWISISTAHQYSQVYQQHPEWMVQDENGDYGNLHSRHEDMMTACFGTDWKDYIKERVLDYVKTYGLEYVKLDLSAVTSAYVTDGKMSGCYATGHPYHHDHSESFVVLYTRLNELFDELHEQAPDLFIDCTFETAGKLQLMDYGFSKHVEGNWLSNIDEPSPVSLLRARQLAWSRTPVIPAANLVIGNLSVNDPEWELGLKSLAGALPVMLGDPRKISAENKTRMKEWEEWLRDVQNRHDYMMYRQDLPGFGEPAEGSWDGWMRINTDTASGGLVGVFRQGAAEDERQVVIPWLHPDKTYMVQEGASGKTILTCTGKELAEKGFKVRSDKKYDGMLYEVVIQSE